VYIADSTVSCGVVQISDLSSTPAHDLRESVPQILHNTAFAIFSDVQGRHGHSLRDYIVKNKLGSVRTIGPKENPNTDNRIYVYVWSVDRDALSRWYHKSI